VTSFHSLVCWRWVGVAASWSWAAGLRVTALPDGRASRDLCHVTICRRDRRRTKERKAPQFFGRTARRSFPA